MRMGWWRLLAVLAGPSLMLLTPRLADAQPIVYRTVTVNCNAPGQSITGALRRYVAGYGLLINFSGTCNENIDIVRDDITIRGTTPTATINGTSNTDQVIAIDGKRVRLESLIVTGGRDGITAGRGGTVTVSGVTVQGVPRLGVTASFGGHMLIDGSLIRQCGSTGVTAANASTVIITNSTVEQNVGGINATRASHLRVGQDANGTTLGPVIVQNNTATGISVSDASAAIIVSTTVKNNGSNGIFIGRGAHADIGIGSFSMQGPVTIQDNVGNGLFVEGGSTNIVGSAISGNSFGIQLANGGNGRIGILPDSTAYLGNTISGNQGHGLFINFGSTALVGGNAISGNGVATVNGAALGAGSRMGVFVSQGTANLIGRNTIESNPDSGIFVRQGQLFVGNGWSNLDTTGNVIRLNGCGAEAASNRSGVFMFEGSTGEIRSTTLTANCGSNVQMFLGGALDIRGSTLSAADPLRGTPAGTPGVLIGTRSSARIGSATIIENNPGDGVSMNNGSALEIRNDIASEIRNNGGLNINCTSGTETSVAIPTTGGVPVFTGNVGGNTTNCTGF
jgi:hypothetical protein